MPPSDPPDTILQVRLVVLAALRVWLGRWDLEITSANRLRASRMRMLGGKIHFDLRCTA